MAITQTLDLQNNPTINHTGKKETDATIVIAFGTLLSLMDEASLRLIMLGYVASGWISYYEIQRAEGGEVMTFNSNGDYSNHSDVVGCEAYSLEIILPFRTWFKVRVGYDPTGKLGITWSDWVYFKTRDKKYQTYDAINQDSINPVTGTTKLANGKTRIIVNNVGKSTVTPTGSGATVTNSDTGSNQTTSVTPTSYGALVINKE